MPDASSLLPDQGAAIVKLHCRIPSAVQAVIDDARIEFGLTKEQVLYKFVMDAANDPRNPWADAYGAGADNSCTLRLAQIEFDDLKPYRRRHQLAKKTAFFEFALRHGARLYEAGQVAKEGALPLGFAASS
jgi:hypothetical protein